MCEGKAEAHRVSLELQLKQHHAFEYQSLIFFGTEILGNIRNYIFELFFLRVSGSHLNFVHSEQSIWFDPKVARQFVANC